MACQCGACCLVILVSLNILPLARTDEWDPAITTDLFVTANTYELIGFVDNAVTMYATVRGDPRPTADDITWLKMQGNLDEDRITITYDTATNESRLRITELTYSDAGTYFCQVNVNGASKSVSMTLRVVVEPGVERVSGLISSKAVGQDAVFSVTVSGNPLPTEKNITWAKLDDRGLPTTISHSRVLYSDGKKEFTITDLVISDEGWYKCLVTTDEGRAEVEFVLHVLGMREIQAEGVGVVSNTATLTCVATYFNMIQDNPTIAWYRYEDPTTPLSGTEITRDVTEHAISTLTLPDLAWSDEGQYFCTSSYTNYPDNSIYNATLYIRGVSSSPVQSTAVLGESAMFQCTATADTEALFYWTRNDVNISGDATTSFSSPHTDTNFTYAGVTVDDESAEFRCVAVFQGQSHASQPASITVLEVTTPPTDVYGVVGNSASLSCSTTGTPAPVSFSWLHEGAIVPSDEERYSLTSDTQLDTTISISELDRSDEGDYSCVPAYTPDALFLGGNTTSQSGRLTIVGLTVPPIQTIVKVGDTAIFTCKANAVPVPTLSWYKDSTVITSGVSSPTTTDGEVVSYLTIEDVGDEDVAPYTCAAMYPSLGQHVSQKANLRFRGIEESPVITRAVIGLSNQLNCTARGEAEADMTWTANGTVITASSFYSIITSSNYDASQEQDLIDTRTILTISEVSLDVSYLDIACTATWVSNGHASEVSSEPVSFYPLYVYDSPKNTIAVRYTKVELSCTATATPLIRWDRSGRTYGVGIFEADGYLRMQSTLIIGNVTTADEGKIWCVAQYEEGMHDSDKAILTVVGIVSEPETTTISQRGQSVQFTCVVDRYPLNNVTWYKGDQEVYGYENRKNMTITTEQYLVEYVLWISSITEDDMSAYYCVVDYPQGSQTSQPAYLLIEEPPEITLIVATGGEKEGDSIELLCQATGVPKPDITWRRGGQEFPSDNTMSVVTIYNEPGSSLVMINTSTSEDQGVYSCVASNGVGDTVIMETELVIESAVQAITIASASSLLGFIVAVCTALMLFALYKKRKRKRLHPNEETKIPPTPNGDEKDIENHVYDNEAVPSAPKIAFELTKATTKS